MQAIGITGLSTVSGTVEEKKEPEPGKDGNNEEFEYYDEEDDGEAQLE